MDIYPLLEDYKK